jgi:hypothetical protein
MDKYSEAELKMNYAKYMETKDPEYLYKAKEIADNWNDNDTGEGKDIAQKVLKLEMDEEQQMGM